MEKTKEKPKSIVVKFETWNQMQKFLFHNGVKSMDDLINRMLNVYEKEVKSNE
jgi:hypothetical protein